MKRLLFASLLFISVSVLAQTAEELHETGKTFMRQGDYSNAELVFNKALQLKPNDAEIQKDQAFNFYLKRDLVKAKQTITPLLDREDADEQIFQIAGNIYLALDDSKECEKIYKKGLKKFPNSGELYNEYGELLLSLNNKDALLMWETGIEKDPNFSGNYYHAARYYYTNNNRVWTILYGEIFLNLESLTARTVEIKNIVLESYKMLFNNNNLLQSPEYSKTKNEFVKAYLTCLDKQSGIAAFGISTETLVMIRTRFILDWNNGYAEKYPYRLFDQHKELLQQGLFDSYNQWLFGAAGNINEFQNWTSLHKEEYAEFNKLQRSRIFKVPAGQYYQSKL